MVWQSSTNEDMPFHGGVTQGRLSHEYIDFYFYNGKRLSQGPACGTVLFGNFVDELHAFTFYIFFTIILFRATSFMSLHYSIPDRFNVSVFARPMHSTSEFAMMILVKCVTKLCVKDGA